MRTIKGDVDDRVIDMKEKKEVGSGPPAQLPWPIRSPPTTHRDHTVSLLFHPRPTGEAIIIIIIIPLWAGEVQRIGSPYNPCAS